MSGKGERSGKCAICRHPEKYRIELLLAGAASVRAICARFEVQKNACWRHGKLHMSQERRAALIAGPLKMHQLADKANELDLSLLDYMSVVRSTLLLQFTTASEAGDRNGVAIVGGRLLEALRLQAQLTGEITKATSTVTNNVAVINHPFMADLQAMLIRVLSPYPEARQAVILALKDMSARMLESAAATTPMIEDASRVVG
jgi:hypothetical protein